MKLDESDSWANKPVKVRILRSPLPRAKRGFVIGDLAECRRGMSVSEPQTTVAISTENVRLFSTGATQCRLGVGSNPTRPTNARQQSFSRIGGPSSKSRAWPVHDSRRALNAVETVNTFSSINTLIRSRGEGYSPRGRLLSEAATVAILFLSFLPLAVCAVELFV